MINNRRRSSDRIRFSLHSGKPGPVVVFFVGIHGNEQAGLAAIDRLTAFLTENKSAFRGMLYVLNGNIPALEAGVRYIDTDLNRIWEVNYDPAQRSRQEWFRQTSEYQQSEEIREEIHALIDAHSDYAEDFIFVDIHTTSAQSCAFVLLNDTLSNRQLAERFPAPQILGIEEHIRGTLLSYINNLGYTSIGFEAGAHDDESSIDKSEAFILLMLHHTGLFTLPADQVGENEEKLLPDKQIPQTYYNIKYHRVIDNANVFQMMPGFRNFDPIERNLPLAYENGKLVRSPVSGRIFMPLYQNKGHDGFFIIREVSAFWLELSAWLKNNISHSLLKYLPGVKPYSPRGYLVNMNRSMFYVDEIFHLLGYRISRKDEETIICYRR